MLSNFVRTGRRGQADPAARPQRLRQEQPSSPPSQRAMEAYSRKPEGALYRFNWIFPSEKTHPRGLDRLRRQGPRADRGRGRLLRASGGRGHRRAARLRGEGPPAVPHPTSTSGGGSSRSSSARRRCASQGASNGELHPLRLRAQRRSLPQVPADLRRAAQRTTRATTCKVLRHVQVERFYVSTPLPDGRGHRRAAALGRRRRTGRSPPIAATAACRPRCRT